MCCLGWLWTDELALLLRPESNNPADQKTLLVFRPNLFLLRLTRYYTIFALSSICSAIWKLSERIWQDTTLMSLCTFLKKARSKGYAKLIRTSYEVTICGHNNLYFLKKPCTLPAQLHFAIVLGLTWKQLQTVRSWYLILALCWASPLLFFTSLQLSWANPS